MIGGLQPCSFIDYPAAMSIVIFMQGCNLRCPYCHNMGLVDKKEKEISKEEVFDLLNARRDVIKRVVISGGEPTIHPQLENFIIEIRSLGYKIKLDTNGTNPDVIEKLIFFNLLDYIAMDLKDEPKRYAWLGNKNYEDNIAKSIKVITSSNVDHELRTTIMLPYHNKEKLIRMSRFALNAKRWILQPYKQVNDNLPNIQSPSMEALEKIALQIQKDYKINCYTRASRI